MESLLELLKPIVEMYASSFPSWLLSIFMIVGSLRLIMKPIMSLIEAYVLITPKVEDDGLPAKIMESKPYKILAYLADWSASIKLPKKK